MVHFYCLSILVQQYFIMLFCYVNDTMILMFLQDSQSGLNDIVYAGISKSMYAGSVLSVDSKFRLMKFDSDGTFRESILAVT